MLADQAFTTQARLRRLSEAIIWDSEVGCAQTSPRYTRAQSTQRVSVCCQPFRSHPMKRGFDWVHVDTCKLRRVQSFRTTGCTTPRRSGICLGSGTTSLSLLLSLSVSPSLLCVKRRSVSDNWVDQGRRQDSQPHSRTKCGVVVWDGWCFL